MPPATPRPWRRKSAIWRDCAAKCRSCGQRPANWQKRRRKFKRCMNAWRRRRRPGERRGRTQETRLLAAAAQENAHKKVNACINNLRLIDSAKQQWALENRKQATDTPTMDDLRPYIGRGPNGELPGCRRRRLHGWRRCRETGLQQRGPRAAVAFKLLKRVRPSITIVVLCRTFVQFIASGTHVSWNCLAKSALNLRKASRRLSSPA